MDKTLDLDELERVAKRATQARRYRVGPKVYARGHGVPLLTVNDLGPSLGQQDEDATYIATFDPPTILTLIAAARPAVVSDEVVERMARGFLAVWYDWHGDPGPWWRALTDDRRAAAMRAALALLPGGVPDREAIGSQISDWVDRALATHGRFDSLELADAIITMLSGPAVPDGWSDLEMAEAFYRAMYEDQGGKWYAVDPSAHPFWIKASQKFVRAMLSASPKEVSPTQKDNHHGS